MTLTHLDAAGQAHMVDIGSKPATARRAIARGTITMSAAARAAIATGTAPKGDVLATARIAGIMAAKQTAGLIPLCHPLPLDAVSLDLSLTDTGVTATATVGTTHGTGVEMEAMTAVSIALLTLYDMAKSIDKAMIINDIRLILKEGGKSDTYHAP
ncbi:cyclic pyranopterin monophosphate synthase MoaC [Sandaracinobacteroides saxicola]|uniref:Cyclic pyranopterin monophosphate synthase n=1 Tax=Sandaracinobacteroides saxicola TaxID=2759707 RepID=A0A7G5IEI2_9SPHN|nr:cyclic pyranopterin monophosphate synthase MoaC [Sandaracinobacteroides saxicola]QMW21774.1 cyclic pyranopterin monophosphate synthase MoaC [Sandaracinobacteroides saxicola]